MTKYCEDCNNEIVNSSWNAVYCKPCRIDHMNKKTHSAQHASRVIVTYAVKGGILPKLDGSIMCVDCESPA